VSRQHGAALTGTDRTSKAWYLLGPVTRFQVGNNLTCEIAQVELEVTRDSQSGFHVYQRPEVGIAVSEFETNLTTNSRMPNCPII
jgi:hypothetical protein